MSSNLIVCILLSAPVPNLAPSPKSLEEIHRSACSQLTTSCPQWGTTTRNSAYSLMASAWSVLPPARGSCNPASTADCFWDVR